MALFDLPAGTTLDELRNSIRGHERGAVEQDRAEWPIEARGAMRRDEGGGKGVQHIRDVLKRISGPWTIGRE